MNQKENDEQHRIKNTKEKTKAIKIQKHKSNYADAKHNDEQLNSPLLHVPDANQGNELKGDDDAQNHWDKIAHALNGRHK